MGREEFALPRDGKRREQNKSTTGWVENPRSRTDRTVSHFLPISFSSPRDPTFPSRPSLGGASKTYYESILILLFTACVRDRVSPYIEGKQKATTGFLGSRNQGSPSYRPVFTPQVIVVLKPPRGRTRCSVLPRPGSSVHLRINHVFSWPSSYISKNLRLKFFTARFSVRRSPVT